MAQRYGYHEGGHPFYLSQTNLGIEITDMVDTKRWIIMPEAEFKEMVEDWAEYFRTQPARTRADWEAIDRERTT